MFHQKHSNFAISSVLREIDKKTTFLRFHLKDLVEDYWNNMWNFFHIFQPQGLEDYSISKRKVSFLVPV